MKNNCLCWYAHRQPIRYELLDELLLLKLLVLLELDDEDEELKLLDELELLLDELLDEELMLLLEEDEIEELELLDNEELDEDEELLELLDSEEDELLASSELNRMKFSSSTRGHSVLPSKTPVRWRLVPLSRVSTIVARNRPSGSSTWSLSVVAPA